MIASSGSGRGLFPSPSPVEACNLAEYINPSAVYMRRARGTKLDGEEIRAFARWRGCTERAARNYRRDPKTGEPKPEWVAWQQQNGRPGCGAQTSPAAPVENKDREWQRAARAQEEAWRTLVRLQDECAAAPPELLPHLTRAAAEARKMWQAACEHANTSAVNSGQLVPLSTIRKLQVQLVPALGVALRAYANNIAQRLHPEARPAFYAAHGIERAALNTHLRNIDAALETLLQNA